MLEYTQFIHSIEKKFKQRMNGKPILNDMDMICNRVDNVLTPLCYVTLQPRGFVNINNSNNKKTFG